MKPPPSACRRFCLLFSVALAAYGGVEESPQRTEDARTLPADEQRARLGFGMWEEDGGPKINEMTFSYSRGFAGGLELGLALPYVDADPLQGKRTQGVSDARFYGELAIGDALFSEWERPVDGISLSLTLFMETFKSDKKLRRHDRQSEFTVNFLKDLGPATAHVSTGLAGYDNDFERPGERVESSLLFRAGLERTLPHAGTLYLDWTWQENEDAHASTDPNEAGLGFRRELDRGISLDVGFWMGLSRTAPDTRFVVGLSRAF